MELDGDRSVIADVVATVVRVGVLLLPTVVGVNTTGFGVDLPIYRNSEQNHAITIIAIQSVNVAMSIRTI